MSCTTKTSCFVNTQIHQNDSNYIYIKGFNFLEFSKTPNSKTPNSKTFVLRWSRGYYYFPRNPCSSPYYVFVFPNPFPMQIYVAFWNLIFSQTGNQRKISGGAAAICKLEIAKIVISPFELTSKRFSLIRGGKILENKRWFRL